MSMRRLTGVELTRFRSRRAVVVLMLLSALATVLVAVALIRSTTPPSADEVQRAEQRAAAEAERPTVQRSLERCLDRPSRFGAGPADGPRVQERCEDIYLPTAEWFLYTPELRPASEIDDTALAVVALALLAVMLSAITFAGADWSTGSITNQLLATPSRSRLWSAKALVVTAVSGGFTTIVLGAWWLAVLGAAWSRDIDPDANALALIGWQVVRVGVLGAGAGLAAYALTMLLRSTVASLAVVTGYALVGDFLLNVLPVADAERIAVTTNVLAWVQGSYGYYSEQRCFEGSTAAVYADLVTGAGRCDPYVLVSQADGGLFLVVLVALVVVASLLGFRRRDV